MPITKDDLAQLTDHIVAVQNLLLSHVIATETFQEGSAKATIDLLRGLRDQAVKTGRWRVAARLDAFVDEIDQCLDF